jgi:hypothetical protein
MQLLTKCSKCSAALSLPLPNDTSERIADIIARAVLCDGCKSSAEQADKTAESLVPPSMTPDSGDQR